MLSQISIDLNKSKLSFCSLETHCRELHRVTRSYGDIINSFQDLHHGYIRTKSLYRQGRSELSRIGLSECFDQSIKLSSDIISITTIRSIFLSIS